MAETGRWAARVGVNIDNLTQAETMLKQASVSVAVQKNPI